MGVRYRRLKTTVSTDDLLAFRKRETAWMECAKCRGKLHAEDLPLKLYRAHPRDAARAAWAMCRGCPVRRECALDALYPIVYYAGNEMTVRNRVVQQMRPRVTYTAETVRAGVIIPALGKEAWCEAMGRLIQIAGKDNVPDALKVDEDSAA